MNKTALASDDCSVECKLQIQAFKICNNSKTFKSLSLKESLSSPPPILISTGKEAQIIPHDKNHTKHYN